MLAARLAAAFLLVAVVAACADEMGKAAPADSGLAQADLFVSGPDGYNTFRIPSLTVTRSGALLAFCEGRKRASSDDGDVDLVYRRSQDGGKTWGPVKLLYEEGGDAAI